MYNNYFASRYYFDAAFFRLLFSQNKNLTIKH